ncbi:MAG: putative Oxidoreductase, 2OG-Fe(II) oxygenase family [Ilumatobacteraceae bacterium]|nr:putative Oxidoreductase, 2OG-Fe(II) oxygenase family [Ilumatobacteraceae bacterium]
MEDTSRTAQSEPASAIVPVIDLQPWWSGDAAARRGIAAAIDQACRTSGFFQVVGHGIEPVLVAEVLDAVDEFFHLSDGEKREVQPDADHINRGFLPIGSEALSYTVGVGTPADLREAFVLGPDVVPDDEVHRADPYHVFAANLWPARPPAMRPALVAYFDAVSLLASTLIDVYALALDLPDRWFQDFNRHTTETLRVNYYERLADDAPAADGQQRLGAHTDYGITTVLYADRVPGLQLLGADGAWSDVLAEPGAFIVNLGDLLAQWTNDRWRSTVHRVLQLGAHGTRRRSLAFFLDGDYDAVVECLPTCVDDEHPPRYPPTTAGEHLAEKLRGARTLSAVATIDTVGDRITAVRGS